jgi:hypothetical protein
VSVKSLETILSHLTAGPTAHRAQQATAQQQLLMSALDKQSAAAARQERALAAERRQLLKQVSLPLGLAVQIQHTVHCNAALFGANLLSTSYGPYPHSMVV